MLLKVTRLRHRSDNIQEMLGKTAKQSKRRDLEGRSNGFVVALPRMREGTVPCRAASHEFAASRLL